eukprot:156410-Chlamydomonas_euryale.AAC.6
MNLCSKVCVCRNKTAPGEAAFGCLAEGAFYVGSASIKLTSYCKGATRVKSQRRSKSVSLVSIGRSLSQGGCLSCVVCSPFCSLAHVPCAALAVGSMVGGKPATLNMCLPHTSLKRCMYVSFFTNALLCKNKRKMSFLTGNDGLAKRELPLIGDEHLVDDVHNRKAGRHIGNDDNGLAGGHDVDNPRDAVIDAHLVADALRSDVALQERRLHDPLGVGDGRRRHDGGQDVVRKNLGQQGLIGEQLFRRQAERREGLGKRVVGGGKHGDSGSGV